eukprot:343642-Prorocentrum_minimum.AAC.7
MQPHVLLLGLHLGHHHLVLVLGRGQAPQPHAQLLLPPPHLLLLLARRAAQRQVVGVVDVQPVPHGGGGDPPPGGGGHRAGGRRQAVRRVPRGRQRVGRLQLRAPGGGALVKKTIKTSQQVGLGSVRRLIGRGARGARRLKLHTPEGAVPAEGPNTVGRGGSGGGFGVTSATRRRRERGTARIPRTSCSRGALTYREVRGVQLRVLPSHKRRLPLRESVQILRLLQDGVPLAAHGRAQRRARSERVVWRGVVVEQSARRPLRRVRLRRRQRARRAHRRQLLQLTLADLRIDNFGGRGERLRGVRGGAVGHAAARARIDSGVVYPSSGG